MNVLIYHTLEDSLGGAELVLIHTMNYFLKNPGTTVTVLGFMPPNLEDMKKFSGIELPADRVRSVQPVMPSFLKFFPAGLFLIKAAILQRTAKKISHDYDLCISTCNEVDFGKRGLQYMHHPQFVSYKLLNKYKIIHEKSLLNRYPYISWPYMALVGLLSGNRKGRIENNISMTNSNFMKNVIREAYNIDAKVVYPSLIDMKDFEPSPTDKKAFRMSYVGRIHSDKGVLELIDLYAAIHRRVPSLELVIAGKVTDMDYYKSVIEKAQALSVPVSVQTDLSRTDLQALLKTSLFYINSKTYEHFGIATLEAMTAGCLPFVHKSGGSIEIVPAPELHYLDQNDLADKVERLANDEALRNNLISSLAAHQKSFSVDHFNHGLNEAVMEFIQQQPVAMPALMEMERSLAQT